MLLSFFRAAYTLYLFSYSQHGLMYSGLYSCSLCHVREFLLTLLHWLPLNLFILRANVVTFWV
jgi:NADH-ubiquinone oxidoreductase chain 4